MLTHSMSNDNLSSIHCPLCSVISSKDAETLKKGSLSENPRTEKKVETVSLPSLVRAYYSSLNVNYGMHFSSDMLHSWM